MSVTPKIDVSIPTRAFIIVGLSIAALTIFYFCVPTESQGTVIFFTVVLAAGSAILTAFYAAKALEISIHAHNNQITQNRKEAAMRFGERWNDPNMYHVREVCRNIFEKASEEDADLNKIIESRKTNVIHILNFFEELAIAIKYDTLDTEIVINQFGGIMKSAWSILEPWIVEYRKFRERPLMWVVLEELVNEWNGDTK